jgi:hypothetical protein
LYNYIISSQTIEGNIYFPDSLIVPSTGTLTVNGSYINKATLLPSETALVLILTNSGTVYYLAQVVANSTVTLLAIARSVRAHYKFISTSIDDGTAHIWTISAPTAVLKGYYDGVAARIVGTLFGTQTNLIYSVTAANIKAGDWAKF